MVVGRPSSHIANETTIIFRYAIEFRSWSRSGTEEQGKQKKNHEKCFKNGFELQFIFEEG